ncbi:MAG: hypothetical protein IJ307_00520 [Bacteroidales bacterium]|nr:hypothetical protein [Bacteroidales bacterium]
MKHYSISAILILLFAVSCVDTYRHPLASELERLDSELARMEEYVNEKEAKISTIEGLLASEDLSLEQKYGLYGQLYHECVAYQFDMAKDILESQEKMAAELGDRSLMNSAVVEKAMLFTTAGMFLEAQELFQQLDTTTFNYQQKISWYNARQKFLHDYQEYVRTSGITVPEAVNIRAYQDLILKNTPKDSPLNHHIHIMRLIEEQRWDEAYSENLRIIEGQNKSSRDYAVQCYWQGFICENLEREEETIKWWIESAICDIRGAIKDNAALCSVAIKLTDPHDTDRAFRYIRISLDDAIFYNAKLRKVQIASTFPWIEKAYRDSRDLQIKDRSRYLMVTVMVALLLLVILTYTVHLYRKRQRTVMEIEAKNAQLDSFTKSIMSVEEDLRRTNLDLVEANAAKEEYLGLFLSMCSGYLDKLRKTLPRDQYDAELKNFYKTFDTSFLSLYPTFVEDLNALLTEKGRIVVKEGELLNTELRIFALIKLGITQSSHIASLLRYSVNTIYNYRAQVKNAAVSDRENFEENVRKIGSARA